MKGGGPVGSRGNVVATLIIIVVLLASFYLVTRTYFSTETVPLLSIPKGDAVTSVQDVLNLAVREWAAKGMVESPYACNGVYQFSDDDLLALLRTIITGKLAAFSQTQNGSLAIGQLDSTQFRGEDGIIISLGNSSFVYNDEAIHAESQFRSDYVVAAQAKLFHDVTEQWLSCDAGNISTDIADGFGACYFDKLADCQFKQTMMNHDDWSLIYSYNATEETLAAGVQRAIDTLNDYFAGNGSCGPPLVQAPTGITCSFSLSDVSVTNQYQEFSATYVPLAGAAVGMAKPRPVTEKLYGFTDSDLGCGTNITRSPAATPLRPGPYTLNVGLLQNLQPTYDIGPAPRGKYDAVASARSAKFTVHVTCSDSRNMLLGLPLEYSFSFRDGLTVACELPDKMVPDRGGCGGACGSHPNCPACSALAGTDCPAITALCEKATQAGSSDPADQQAAYQLYCGNCTKASDAICCGGMGLGSAYTKDEWNAACCGALDCKTLMDSTASCFNWECKNDGSWDPNGAGSDEASQCQEDTSSVRVGASCGAQDGCSECLADGSCAVPSEKIDTTCGTATGGSNDCRRHYCTADGCSGSENVPDGQPCTLYAEPGCAGAACSGGNCLSTATDKPCTTTKACPPPQTGFTTYSGTCQGVVCDANDYVSDNCQSPQTTENCQSQGCQDVGGDGQCCGGAGCAKPTC